MGGGEWREKGAVSYQPLREGLSVEVTVELRPKWQVEAEDFPDLGPGSLWIEFRSLGKNNYISIFTKLKMEI